MRTTNSTLANLMHMRLKTKPPCRHYCVLNRHLLVLAMQTRSITCRFHPCACGGKLSLCACSVAWAA